MLDLRKMTVWTIAITALFSYQSAEATSRIDVNTSLAASNYRVFFKADASMPNHYAFLNMMENFSSDNSKKTKQKNLTDVQSLFKIPEQSAQAFIQIIVQSYAAMTSNNHVATQKMLCSKELYIDDRAATHELLDVLDDIKETNLVRQYQLTNLAASHLGVNQHNVSTEFKEWLDILKRQQTHHKFNHAALYRQSEENVETVVSRSCRFLAAN